MLSILKTQKEWKKFNENLLLITKRRGQHKKVEPGTKNARNRCHISDPFGV